MKKIAVLFLFLLCFFSSEMSAQDKATLVKAYIEQANYNLSKGDYVKAKAKANEVLKLSPGNAQAKQILAKCQAKAEQQIVAEKTAFKSALSKGTVDALQFFLKRYPKSQFRQEALNAISDLELWNKAKKVNTKDAYEDYLNLSKFKFYEEDAKQAIADILVKDEQEYMHAYNQGTIDAYQQYLKNYPKGVFADNARNNIEDLTLWQVACDKNTEASYTQYLKESKHQNYDLEAKNRIKQIKSEQEWEKIKDSDDFGILENFKNTYPNSIHTEFVNYKINLLKGEYYFNQGYRTDMVLKHYENANKYLKLEGQYEEHYKELKAQIQYEQILDSSNEIIIKDYLSKMSLNDVNYDNVSNHLAIVMANSLTKYSSEARKVETLRYAKDKKTKEYVKNSITVVEYNKKMDSYSSKTSSYYGYGNTRSNNKRKRRPIKIRLGIQGDVEANINGANEEDGLSGSCNYYSAGFAAIIGDPDQWVNVLIGVNYRWFTIMPEHDYSEHHENYGGTISVPFEIRCNLIRTGDNSRIYVGGGVESGFRVNDGSESWTKGCLNNSFVSLYPMLGFTSRHFDIGLYWKSYVYEPFKKEIIDADKSFYSKSLIGAKLSIFF